jgi:alkanesulfonate monooxygenase SsuD/methylene tetrahydromethanopterin reductase-like flavin-dependent oxidoreductase (luciferase family)
MIEGQEGVTWDDWCALAAACEEYGVETLFRSDHYSGFHGGAGALDAWATLAGLAARTEKLRLATLVSPATFRHPSVLAKNAVTVDHISGGRVELGMGAGWHEPEHVEHGFEFRDAGWRVARFAEQLEIVHRQLNDDRPFDLDGRFYTLRGSHPLPKPVQRPLPILVGGTAKRGTAEAAARFASEYNTTFATLDDCRSRRRRLDEACEQVGRDPASLPLSLMTFCLVGTDAADVSGRRRETAEFLGRSLDEVPRHPDAALVGTVDEVAERLQAYAAAGVTRVMCQHLLHRDTDMVELLGRELAPAVA